MDQTAVFFEPKSSVMIDEKGKKTISVRDSGSDSKRCTVIVSVAADGTKLPLFYVFKGVPGGQIEKGLESNGIKGCCQLKGWFDSETVAEKWINTILVPYLSETEMSFLLVDHFKCHLTHLFTSKIAALGCDIDYIPAGYTCVLQPVDVGVNAPLKRGIRELHHEWCIEKYQGVLNEEKLPVPSREDIMSWVEQSYEKIKPESIVKTFHHIGLIDTNDIEEEVEAEIADEDIEEAIVNAIELNGEAILVEEEGLYLVPPTLI